MLGGMRELEWLIFRSMKPAKRVRRFRMARRLYEHRLTDAEAQVMEIRAALQLIEDAMHVASLRSLTGSSDMTLSGWTRL